MLAGAPGGAVARDGLGQAGAEEGAARLALATGIQSATRSRLGVLGDAFDCADARFVSFRRSDAEPQFADQWYVASQLWADAVLLRVAAQRNADGEPLVMGWDALDSHC